jgi:hypothetical protein
MRVETQTSKILSRPIPSRRLQIQHYSSVAAFLCGLLLPRAAFADGGLLRASETAGPFIITVFSSPTPLRAGPADISVMVQERDTGAPALDAQVTVTAQRSGDGLQPVVAAATRAQATNKLLYAALVDLTAAGSWDLHVTVNRDTATARITTTLAVGPPLPRLLAFWPYLALPPAAILLFALHQWLRLRAV